MSHDDHLNDDPQHEPEVEHEDIGEGRATAPSVSSRVISMEELRAARDDDEDLPDFTFSELQEALADESHPRHEEAVEANRAMAERLRPRLLALNESVMRQIMPSTNILKGMKFPSGVLPETSTLSSATAAAVAGAVPKFEMPKIDVPKPPTMPAFSIPEPAEIDYEGIEEAARLRAEREARQDENAALSLEVQQSMAANLELLGDRMKDVEDEIREGNSSSGKVAIWTLVAAVLTLLATIGLGWAGLLK